MMNLEVNNDNRKQRVFAVMYLKRFVSLRQMDLDYSFSQMIQICLSPSKVYKMTAWRKQTKNQWARDDPSFMLITLAFVAVSAAAFSTAIRPLCVSCFIRSILQSVLFSVVFGLIVSTISWYCINRFMRIQRPHSPEQFVEWLYALDIQFNSFFPAFLICGVVQYILLPILMMDGWLANILSGILFISAIIVYSFISFLGYMYLPFVKTPFVLLVIGGIASIVVLFIMAFGTNLTSWWITRYFINMQ